MSSPRPHLRLVGPPRGDDGPGDEDHENEDGSPSGLDNDLDSDADATLDDDPGRAARSARLAVVALVAFQLLAALSYGGKYATLASGGGEYAAAALLAAPAALCLYAGAALLALRPGRGRAWFLVAAVGLGLSIPLWGVSYGWTWPVAFGAMLGLAGAWFARLPAPLHDDEAPPPDEPQVIAFDDGRSRRDH